jgi:hypothetical protein
MVIYTGALVRMALFQLLNTSLKFLKSKVVLCIDVTELLHLITRHQVNCLSVISNPYPPVAEIKTHTIETADL